MIPSLSAALSQLIAEFACVAWYNRGGLYQALTVTFYIYEWNSLFLFHSSKTVGWH